LLAAFFGLAALTVLTLRAQSWSATLLFALGLLCKPSLAVLPLASLAFAPKRKKIFSLWLALGAAALGFTLSLQAPFADPRLEASLPGRILIAADSLGFYVRNLVLPYPLSFSYDRNIEDVLSERLYILSLVYLFCAAGAVHFLARRFGRRVYASAAFGLVFLLPVSGIVPFAGQVQSAGFDRYMYLPLFGVAAIAALVAQVKWARYTLFALVIISAGLSFDRVRDWKNDRALADAALEIDPTNYLALNNLAVTEIAEKDYAAAENHLRAAWDSHPKEALAPANLAHALWLKNDVGGILKEIKPLTETAIFLEYNRREIEALALIHRMTARALNATLDREGAAKAYEKALAYRPDDDDLRAEIALFEKESR
jgi:tetratricopeptide (TPR) repeat protein